MRVFSDNFLVVKKLGDDGGYDYRFGVSRVSDRAVGCGYNGCQLVSSSPRLVPAQ